MTTTWQNCKDHPKLGHCVLGKNDDSNGEKYWTFCTMECSKGGICKKLYKVLFIIVIIDDLYTLSLNNINNTSIISIKFVIN